METVGKVTDQWNRDEKPWTFSISSQITWTFPGEASVISVFASLGELG